LEDAEILCQIRGKAPVWVDAVLDMFGTVGGSHWSESSELFTSTVFTDIANN
jgi:hypothetical protein